MKYHWIGGKEYEARAKGRASTFEEAKQALAQAVGLASLDGLESADVEFVVIYYVDDDPECPYAWAIFRNEEEEAP